MDKLTVIILRFYVWEIKFPFNKIRYFLHLVCLVGEGWTTAHWNSLLSGCDMIHIG